MEVDGVTVAIATPVGGGGGYGAVGRKVWEQLTRSVLIHSLGLTCSACRLRCRCSSRAPPLPASGCGRARSCRLLCTATGLLTVLVGRGGRMTMMAIRMLG